MGLPDALADSVDVLLTDIDDVTGVVEVADGLEVAVVDEGSDGVQLWAGLGLGLLDSDADAEAERADILLAEDGDAAAAVCVSEAVCVPLLVVLAVADTVTGGEPDCGSLEIALADEGSDGVQLRLGLGLGLLDRDADSEAERADTLLAEDGDAAAAVCVSEAVCVSLLAVLTLVDAVTDEEPDSVPLAEMLPECDVDGAVNRDGDVLGLPLPLPLGDVVPVSDGDGDAETHTLDPAMLEVPDGHTALVDDVDPGPQ